MPSEGLGFGPVATPAPTPAVAQTGVFQSQPGQAPPAEPPVRTINLRINEPPSLTLEQKEVILANLVEYQQHGYPWAQWNALNTDDQALLVQAGIEPQAAPAPAPAPTSSNTGTVIAFVTVVGLAGVTAWYFWDRK